MSFVDGVTLTRVFHLPLTMSSSGSDHRREMLEVEDVEQRQRRLRMCSAFFVASLHLLCLQKISLKI